MCGSARQASVSGFGHLLIAGQAGFLDYDKTARSIHNFAHHVFPRLKAEISDNKISRFSAAARYTIIARDDEV